MCLREKERERMCYLSISLSQQVGSIDVKDRVIFFRSQNLAEKKKLCKSLELLQGSLFFFLLLQDEVGLTCQHLSFSFQASLSLSEEEIDFERDGETRHQNHQTVRPFQKSFFIYLRGEKHRRKRKERERELGSKWICQL